MSDNSFLKRQILRYRDLLANLSRRNRELYFRESKAWSINLAKDPFPATHIDANCETPFSAIRPTGAEFDQILKGEGLDLQKFFRIKYVVEKDSAAKLIKKLDKIRVADDRHQREFGISGAWLLGPFLLWRTSFKSPKADLLISPILKIPVNIRKNKKNELCLEAEDESLTISPTLRLCLKQNTGCEIPEDIKFETVTDAIEYLKSALAKVDRVLEAPSSPSERLPKIPSKMKIIKDENGEIIERKPIVLEEELSPDDLAIYEGVTANNFLLFDLAYLDQLNTSRTVLINDYEAILNSADDHPIIRELFNGSPVQEGDKSDREKLRQLDGYKERDNHFVVNIDSTQHRAIDQANNSKAIVIQGPPGTGKSQTITNLIADFIAKGKRVLFVSEKRPALDVVFNRLKLANIESQAVLIHSSDLNKSDLYKSFLELAETKPSATDAQEWQSAADSLDSVKSDLNAYADTLVKTHHPSNLYFADVIVEASYTNRSLFRLELANTFGHLSFDRIIKLKDDLRFIRQTLGKMGNFKTSPWRDRLPTTIKSATLVHDLKQVDEVLSSAKSEIDKLTYEFRELCQSDFNLEIIQQCRDYLNKCPRSKISGEELRKLWSVNANPLDHICRLRDLFCQAVEKLKLNAIGFNKISPGSDPAAILELEKYYVVPAGMSDWFTPIFWKMRKLRKRVIQSWDGTSKAFAEFREFKATYDQLVSMARETSTTPIPNADNGKQVIEWVEVQIGFIDLIKASIESAHQLLPTGISSRMVQGHAQFTDAFQKIERAIELGQRISEINDQARGQWAILGKYISQAPAWPDSPAAAAETIRGLQIRLDDLTILDQAEERIQSASRAFDLPNLKTIIWNTFQAPEIEWESEIESSVLNSWEEQLFRENPTLRTYSREKIVGLVERFRAAEQNHRDSARQAIHHGFASRWAQSDDRSGLPLLRKESAKQKKVLSPREIMERGALATMMQLKPCWLMSPLSISQMLPLRTGLFDVIIFDEASQVRVEDAIPSIFRANSMIVVGDNKQMPPTSFFSGSLPDDNDEEEEEISESILDLAAMVYPSVLLEWHYRSREEALIAFSNRAFYEGRLIAAPNPATIAASKAIEFIRVEDAYFSTKNGNPNEADRVIQHLIKLIGENPSRSFGVIAMGQSQAVALEEALEKAMASDSRARTLIERASAHKDGDADAGLFIKNLENVQGDERDIILMSAGYAPGAPGKRVYQNFGPLSKQGGGRRLNVAVTRAKSKIVVFCSFDPGEIKTDEEAFTHNPHLCIFGRYLSYAKAISEGNSPLAQSILDKFPMGGVRTGKKSSRFALDVKRRLEEIGHRISAEIGSCGFYIDLCVHHPAQDSAYVLGIECDGAIFHSTPYARDRDKIREDLLKSRGWKISRVWSQDWSKDWKSEVERLDREIRALLGETAMEQLKKASGS